MFSKVNLIVSMALMSSIAAGCANLGLPSNTKLVDKPAEELYASINRPAIDEIVYFVIPDRFENGDPSNDKGGIEGDWKDHGFKPDDRGFYLGGDLKGLTSRLGYIKDLGVTAIWLGPVFQNKAVQGGDGWMSSGYHGYWITDFTRVDAHLGSNEDMQEFVDTAHSLGMKVYLDIITNHTADVILYRECDDPDMKTWVDNYSCPYKYKGEYPWTTVGGPDGRPINDGFMGDAPEFQTEENFAKLTNPNFAYTPFVPEGEEGIKKPEWLNDLTLYHNRGHTTFVGENSLYGDFGGLDDLMTEHPKVVQGFIEIYKDWITKYRIDGFRIDTARHVNDEFWQQFVPAILKHAKSIGIPHFHIFGEVANGDPAYLASYTKEAKFPSVLDFAFRYAVRDVMVNGEPTRRFADIYRADSIYVDGATAILPTFIGNHDDGRFAGFLRIEHPDMSDEEIFKRVRLGHALMILSRGVPVIYYGAEQGFVSDGNDKKARETMFPSMVPDYNDNDLVATDMTTADSNFDRGHPLYRAFSEMIQLRRNHSALRRGETVVRLAEHDGGLLAISRIEPDQQGEVLVVFNTRKEDRKINIEVDARSQSFETLSGKCEHNVSATGSYTVSVPALDFIVCRSSTWN